MIISCYAWTNVQQEMFFFLIFNYSKKSFLKLIYFYILFGTTTSLIHRSYTVKTYYYTVVATDFNEWILWILSDEMWEKKCSKSIRRNSKNNYYLFLCNSFCNNIIETPTKYKICKKYYNYASLQRICDNNR